MSQTPRPNPEPDASPVASPPRRVLLAIAIFLIAILAYTPVMVDGGFIWDDDMYVQDNVLLQTLDGLGQIWVPFRTPQYYPMTFSTFWVEHQLWQTEPRGYHVVNVVLHAINALLVWLVFARLRVPGAWLIAALFALHPVHVESVAWITERKNVLSGMFYLLSALCYLRFDRLAFARSPGQSRSDAWGWYGLALVLFIAALLSKTVTCSLPAALILAMLWRGDRLTARRLAPLAPMFIIGLALAMFTAYLERVHVGTERAAGDFDFSFIERVLIASRAFLFYPWKVLVPYPLMFNYPRWVIDATDPVDYWPVVVVVVITIAAVTAYRRGWRGIPLALAFYAGTVFPAVGFFNVYPHRFSFVADHFQYLASLGTIAAVVAVITALVKQRNLVIVGLLALPVLFGLTWMQSSTYESRETVWRDTLSKNDNAFMPHNNLGFDLLRQAEQLGAAGDAEAADAAVIEARSHFERALEIKPDYNNARIGLSEVLRYEGRFEEALEQARIATDLNPDIARNHWHRGRLHDLLGQVDEAVAAYRTALDLNPAGLEARTELARILAVNGRFPEATEQYQALLEQEPDHVPALNFLGEMAERAGNCPQAEHFYRRAANAARDQGSRLQVVFKLARVLTLCPDEAQRNPREAAQILEGMIQFMQEQPSRAIPPYLAIDLLATAYAGDDRLDDAVRAAAFAQELARRAGDEASAARIGLHVGMLEAERDGRAPDQP